MDTLKTLRASPAALVAMHSNHPSSRGPGLVMSSDPEDCRLHGQSSGVNLCPMGNSEKGRKPMVEPFGG